MQSHLAVVLAARSSEHSSVIEPRWITAKLEEISSRAELPVAGLELTPEEEEDGIRERVPRAVSM